MSNQRDLTPDQDEALNRTVKGLEWWSLLRSAFPLIAAGVGVSIMYSLMASGEEGQKEFWLGPVLGLAGSACALIGYVGRLREIKRPGAPTTKFYPLLFLGWVLVAAGALIPPYTAG